MRKKKHISMEETAPLQIKQQQESIKYQHKKHIDE